MLVRAPLSGGEDAKEAEVSEAFDTAASPCSGIRFLRVFAETPAESGQEGPQGETIWVRLTRNIVKKLFRL